MQIQAQTVQIPKDTIWQALPDTFITIGKVDAYKLGEVLNDTVMFQTTKYPWFVPAKTVDDIWNKLAYHGSKDIAGIRYKATSKKYFNILRSGSVELVQRIRVSKKVIEEKTKDEQLWYLLKVAKTNNYPVNAFWKHKQVTSITTKLTVTDTPINTTQ